MTQVQTQPQILSDKQREAFARIIADAKKQAQVKAEEESDLERRIKKEIAPQLAKKRGALLLVRKIQSLRRKLDTLEEPLSKLGFDCSDDSISIRYDAPKVVDNAVEAAVKSALKERDAEIKKFDRAILRVWTAESIAEAQRIVEELL